MAFKLLEKILVTSAAEPLSAVSIKSAQAQIQVKRSNDHKVEVGDSTLVANKGEELLAPAVGVTLPTQILGSTGVGNGFDLSTVYIIGTPGEGVNVYYEEY